jgi:hypothetical protein
VVFKMPRRRPTTAGTVALMPPTGSKTLDDWIAPRRAAAIARIVKAVGQPPRDEMLMAADIFQASCEKPSALVLQEGSQRPFRNWFFRRAAG